MYLVYRFLIFLFVLNGVSLYSQQLAQKIGEIPPPGDYKRVKVEKGSFSEYLQNLPLRQDSSIVHLYNGEPKINQEAQYAVIQMDVGKKDLQQCADAVMRLWGEYLYGQKDYNKIIYHFTNGMKVKFVDYAEGYRAKKKKNNKLEWGKFAKRDYSYESFRKYMDLIFTYSGTMSLKNFDSIPLKKHELEIGHFLVQEKKPYGHAVIVVDKAIREDGKIVYLLAQSYMPAQEIHILRNYMNPTISPWYEFPLKNIRTPEWDFTENDWAKFKDHSLGEK
jgi:hypothetical protein